MTNSITYYICKTFTPQIKGAACTTFGNDYMAFDARINGGE